MNTTMALKSAPKLYMYFLRVFAQVESDLLIPAYYTHD